MNKVGPCYGCEEPVRHEGCHGVCVEFIEWDTQNKAEKEKIRKAKKKANEEYQYRRDSYMKEMKRHGKGKR